MRVIRFEDLQRLQATWPQAVESDPEQPLAPVKPESFMRRLVYHAKRLCNLCSFVRDGDINLLPHAGKHPHQSINGEFVIPALNGII